MADSSFSRHAGYARLPSSQANAAPSGPLLQTTFFVPSIHCPSCVNHITTLVSSLPALEALPGSSSAAEPSSGVRDVTVSLLDCTVTLVHDSRPQGVPSDEIDRAYTLRLLAQVRDALREDGYAPSGGLQTKEVAARPSAAGGRKSSLTARIIALPELEEAESRALAQGAPQQSNSAFLPAAARALLHPWKYQREQRQAAELRKRWLRHTHACSACRDGKPHDDAASAACDSSAFASARPDAAQGTWTVTLAIGGMTCASCVNAATSAAQQLNSSASEGAKPLLSINVELLSNSATAIVASQAAASDLAEAIEDAGYDVEIVKVVPNSVASVKWTALYAIGGMTCASCVGNVQKAVSSSIDETSFEFSVALLEGRAEATFEASTKDAAERIAARVAEAINDAGYEAELSKLDCARSSVDAATSSDQAQRTARIRVTGMFCELCVMHVQRYFTEHPARLSGKLQVDADELDRFSLTQPSITISYTPSFDLTLRGILAELSALDPAFEASYIAPPSLASRSAQLARKELINYFVRLCIATVFAIPTVIIAVIAPGLLSVDDPLRVRLMQPAWGGATLMEVSLWLLATPVQFGVGSLFYTRSWKSLKVVWKRGRPWQERLLGWGSMDVLVALGTSISYFTSLVFLIININRGASETPNEAMSFFDASVFLVTFVLLGRLLESLSKRRTGDAVAALGSLRPTTGLLLLKPEAPDASETQEIDVALLEVGDLVLVPAGASPPLDSTFVATSSAPTARFDEASLTGESVPSTKRDGEQLYAGTANASPYPIVARTTALPGDQLLDGILDVVRSASGRKASIERIADKVTGVFVPAIVFLAVLVLLLWLVVLYHGVSQRWIKEHVPYPDEPGARLLYAVSFAVSVVVVACPCGIGLAAPTAQMAGIGIASARGILTVNGGEAFQAASRAGTRRTVFVFDKTGTLTSGVGTVVESILIPTSPVDTRRELVGATLADQEEADNVQICRALDLVEQSSTHPLSEAIRAYCTGVLKDAPVTSAEVAVAEVQEISGKGLQARVRFDERETDLFVGNRRLIDEAGCAALSEEQQVLITRWQDSAQSAVFVALCQDGATKLRAILAIADPVRDEAASVIRCLATRYGAEAWIVSGDAEETAKAVARQVGVPAANVVSGVLPTGKEEAIERIRSGSAEGVTHKPRSGILRYLPRRSFNNAPPLIIFVGDGINDAPALHAADVGVAMGSGSDIAQGSADFILLSATAPLASLPVLLSLSKATVNKVYQNFCWAAVFNLVCLPIAAGVLVPAGFAALAPSWSGLIMALSSTSVVINALTLRLWKPPSM